jgi:hypothetical protein
VTATAEAPEQAVDPLWKGPGIYTADELSLEAYHRDIVPGGSLSSSGARALLDPGCPAQFHHDRQHPQPAKKEWDLGTAVHGIILGSGPEIVVTEHSDWRTKAARDDRDAIRASGGVPLLFEDGEQVTAMAQAIRQHPIAGPLFAPGTGTPEQSLYWTDPETGVMCRVRPDWLKHPPDLTLCVDLKTTKDASPGGVSKAIADYGYHQQDAFYVDGIQAVLGLPARFVFVFVNKTPPYLITVRELSDADRAIGRAKNARALRIYAECERTGIWPDWTGDTPDIPYISLPTWAAQREAEEYLNV